jgi:hypothetical protein
MVDTDVALLDGVSGRRATHDRKPSADVGYRVWNPFEAELQIETGVRHDEVARGFTRALDVFER